MLTFTAQFAPKWGAQLHRNIQDYRNQSAHPNLMDTEKATTFHKQMKECLINLMENYKTK